MRIVQGTDAGREPGARVCVRHPGKGLKQELQPELD